MLAAANKNTGALHDPAVQAQSPTALAERRAALLSALWARIDHAGFYARREDVFTAQPVLTGADVAAEVEAHPPFGRFQLEPAPLIRAGLATAGVPRPTPIAWTRSDLDAEAQLGARALRRTGLGPRGRSADCLDGGLVTPGTLALTDALDALDALALPVGPVSADSALQRAAAVWEIVRPSVLVVDAPSLAFLQPRATYPRPRAFAVLLTPADARALAAPGQPEVFRIFSVPPICTFTAGECVAHDGFHLAEDAVHAEIVDEAAQPLPDGASGRLLLTTLARSLALLRFDTGLSAALDRTPCRCGETHARLRFD
jgi:phenylacetate-CoA ligase